MTDVEYAHAHGAAGLPDELVNAIAACHAIGRPELTRTVTRVNGQLVRLPELATKQEAR